MGTLDDPPAQGQPTTVNKPLTEFSAGFIEAHRHKIFLGLSVAGTLLLGPFAVNNFFQDRVPLGVITSAFVLCLVANALSIARGRAPVVPALAIFAGSALGLATAMYNNGLIGILWVYPGIMLFHFMLPRRQANVLNITLVLLTVPFAWMHLGPQLTARVAVTLTLLIVFSNIFSHIADTQQKKEAEQRGKLDALVRQLEAQNTALLEAFRLREEVERIARHDLKTPLASIASVPRLLRERRAQDATEDELLGMVEGAAQRVLSMVNLSLDLFRMEEGSYRLRAQAVDLGALAQTVASELRAHADSKRMRLSLDLPGEPLYAQGEELLCYSTLANLLKNALEAAPEGSEVQVSLRLQSDADGDCVALDIHNEGQVPEELRNRFFEKYATYGKPDGTGLGAYSARLMARVQRGALRMRSDAGGTTLALRLPLWHAAAPVSARLAPARQEPIAVRPLPAVSVLVVDDDDYNVVVLKNLLPLPPLMVRTAVNGLAALARVRESRPDVIFMDLEMPVLGGVEAVRRIRALEQEQGGPRSFIAAFSAHDDDATRTACEKAGFDVYLAKPASRQEVVAVLRGQDPARVVARPGADVPARVEPSLLALMPEFLDSRRSMAQELAFAVRDGERDKVRETAHKLAGSLAMYGFRDASRAARALEQAVPSEDLPALKVRCDALEQMLAQADSAVRPS